MQPVTITRHTTAAAERVWAVATDLENAADTISAIGRVEVLSPPPFGVGTRWRETRRIMKKDATEEMWISAMEHGRSYTAEAASRGAHYVTTFACTPSPNGGSDITMTFDALPTGMVSRVLSVVMAPLVRRPVAGQLAADLADLAAAAERG